MNDKILKPTSDLIFKLIFGNPKNVDILTNFLQAILDLPKEEYKELTIVDPHLRQETLDDKLSVLDIKLNTKSGKVLNIEIQVSDVLQMQERVVFYTSKMITEQMGKGDDYNLKKVISIIITDYKLIKDSDKYHNKYNLYDINTGSKFSDVIEINTLELPKIPIETDETSLWDWLKFLNSQKEEELSMIAEKNPQIFKAVGILKELSHDERTRLIYEEREKQIRDEKSKATYAIKKGEDKKAHEVAIKALKKGISIEDICELTSLSHEEIEAIQKEIN